jgi:hypothetical protein
MLFPFWVKPPSPDLDVHVAVADVLHVLTPYKPTSDNTVETSLYKRAVLKTLRGW